MKNLIIEYLLQKKFQPKYYGFNYLVHILMITTTTPSRITVGQLYEAAAQAYKVHPHQVERCVRTLIEKNIDSLRTDPALKSCTNAALIYLYTERLVLIAQERGLISSRDEPECAEPPRR